MRTVQGSSSVPCREGTVRSTHLKQGGCGHPSAGLDCLRTAGRCVSRPNRSVHTGCSCPIQGYLSYTTWLTRLHTLTPPLSEVNVCHVKLLTAMASTSSLCFSIYMFSIPYGTANFFDCQGKTSGLFHISPKSSGSQHMGFRNG